MKLVSVIIVNWNAKSVIGQCIESLSRQLHNYQHTICVIDNNSSDGSVDYLKTHYPEVQLIACTKNYGFAVANNIAVHSTESEIIVFVNPDTEIVCNMDLLIKNLNNAAVSFGRLQYPDGQYQDFLRNFPTILNQLGEIFFLPRLFPKKHFFGEMIRSEDTDFYSKAKFISAASGAFFAIKRDVFLEAGMFDEDYFVYGEETDLFYKLRKTGHRIYYDPEIVVVHHHGKSTSQNPKMYTMLQQNRWLFIKKNYGPRQAFFYRYLLSSTYDSTRCLLAFFSSIFYRKEKKRLLNKAQKHFMAFKWSFCNQKKVVAD